MQKLPEILAPVGNWEMCQAAVHNGADAIYVGLPGFNARGRAELLSIDLLREMIEFCHLYGTKVFVAANILIFERELSAIEETLREVLALSPDALIVQDIGLVRLIHKLCPQQVIHASTQMTITNYEAIELTADLHLARYVLGREVSISEMEKIRARTDKELEVFVHGALCVSYSGQCLTSESFGGRSANRGQCAQSCRLSYDLIVDGEVREMGEKRYLVSPQDLCAIDDVTTLTAAGIDSFKIEGRLKSPQYVADTVKQYRARLLDLAESGDPKGELAITYSRGFFNGWMDGVNHQRLVDARFSNHHGLEIGTVLSVGRERVTISSHYQLHPGDGLLFADFTTEKKVGAPLFSVEKAAEDASIITLSREFDLRQVRVGMSVFVNSSPSLFRELDKSYTTREYARRVPLSLFVEGREGEPLQATFLDEDGNSYRATSNATLSPARSAPLTKEALLAELGALGQTPFTIAASEVTLHGDLFLHNKELKEMRRHAVESLMQQRSTRSQPEFISEAEIEGWKGSIQQRIKIKGSTGTRKLTVLVRELAQLDSLAGLAIDTVFLDFEFGKEYAEAVARVRGLGYKVGIATTRILKPGELGHLKVIERLNPDAILVRNLGALEYLKLGRAELIGDFSLNVTNSLTAEWFLNKGISRICPSYDLNSAQLGDLVSAAGGAHFEVTVHQYMPAFHMEHCVFAAFLSTGTSFRDCGRPCEAHRVELRDHTGALHPLKADAECRNTMFNGDAQSAARLIPELASAGVEHFRVEALFESPEELRAKLELYQRAIMGTEEPSGLFAQLGILEKVGVTEGQLFNIRVHKDRRKGEEAGSETSR